MRFFCFASLSPRCGRALCSSLLSLCLLPSIGSAADPAATAVDPHPAAAPSPASVAASLKPADAAAGAAPTVSVSAAAAPLIAPAALGEFVDGAVHAGMSKDGIAGVTVAVVDRNGDLLLRGYGKAALEPPQDVDASTTLFRIGSISKTFTYLATMQLVEQGKLQLDAPINRYLPASLQLADDGHAPIKLWHLLSHTAGFEDSALGHLFKNSANEVLSLDDYLVRYRPQRVREPETHAVYSNYSVALLGAIVAHVSGEPYESYVEQHLLQPLGMRHTTFREPLPPSDPRHSDDAWREHWSHGFHRDAGGFKPEPFEFIAGIAPAGGGSTTAADMARYMRMLLNGGSLDGVQILSPASFAELGNITYRNGDAVGAIAHGFFRLAYGRYQSLEHGGATLYFLSDMVLLPEAGIGVFVSTNTDSGRDFATTLPRLIFEQFLGDARPAPLPPPPKDFASSGQRFVGSYLNERRNYSTLEKFFTALEAVADVGITPDGYLLVSAGDQVKRYVQDGALTFRATEGDQRLQFFADAAGQITGVAGGYGHTYSDRIGARDAPATLGFVIAVLALLCLGVLLGIWRRRAAPARRSSRRDSRSAMLALVLATLAWLAFLIMAILALLHVAAGGSAIVFDYPDASLRWAVALAYLAAALTLLAILLWPSIWKLRSWSFGRKLRHTVVLGVMATSVLLLWHWNVLRAPLALGQ